MTNIHVSNDLKKIISKYVKSDPIKTKNKHLGKWNANLFYKNRGKYLLIINAETKYSFIIPKVKIQELNNITELFCKTLYEQLRFENIPINNDILRHWVKNVEFHKTDNDRKTIGVLNYNLGKIKNGKEEFYDFDNLSIHQITQRLNSIPFKELNWKNPREKMTELLNTSV